MEEETKVLIVATIAWGLRKSSRAIMLALIFLIAMKPGFFHAVYSMLSQLIINSVLLKSNIFYYFIHKIDLYHNAFFWVNFIMLRNGLMWYEFMAVCWYLLCSYFCFSDILLDISFEPQHQQKDTQVYDSLMWGSLCTVIHSSDWFDF